MDEAIQKMYEEAREEGVAKAQTKGYSGRNAEVFAEGFAKEFVESILRISMIPPQ